MDEDRWRRQWEVFHAALEIPGGERTDFVHSACEQDRDLATAILELLAAHEESNPLLDQPALAIAGFGDELDPEALIGEAIDKYTLLSVIGEGGMGDVYLARQHEPVARTVALKIIKLGMNTGEVVRRFRQEQQALAMMNHPNIASVIDGGATADGRPYFVMEYVDGVPITEYCDVHRLDTNARLELLLAVLDGIQHAHQKGLIHRDIKPSNVLVTAGGPDSPSVKIIDFGIAKATGQHHAEKTAFTSVGRLIGTPAYMSPEQSSLAESSVDTRTDVYSTAVLLYELLTGVLPFQTESLLSEGWAAMQRVIREQDPPPPSRRLATIDDATLIAATAARRSTARALTRLIRGELDWIVMRGLEKDPARRYGTASEFAADIGRYLKDLPVLAGPPGHLYRLSKFLRRHTWGVTVSATAMLAVLAFSGLSVWQAQQLSAALAQANVEKTRAERVTQFIIDTLAESEPNNALGADVTVLEALDRGARRLMNELDEEPATKAAILVQMAEIYRELGDYDNARKLLTSAEEALGSMEWPPRASIIEIHQVFANLYHDTGEYEQASARYGQLIGVLLDGDPEQASLVRARKDYGTLLADTGEYERAIEELSVAAELARRVLSPGNVLLGTTLGTLAHTHHQRGDAREARPLFEESVALLRSLGAGSTMELAVVLSGYANFLRESGELDHAIRVQEEVVSIYRTVLGETHPYLATALSSLSGAYTRGGRLEEATGAARESVALHEALFEGAHPGKATAHYELAVATSALGRYAEAERSFREVLSADIATLGEDHPFVFSDLEQIAVTLKHQDRLDEAEDFQRRALEGRIRVLGPEHPDTAGGWLNLSAVYGKQGRHEESATTAERAVEILDGGTETGLALIAARTQLASALYNLERYSESAEIYEGILAIQRRSLADDHPDLARTLHGVGLARLALGQSAVEVLEEALSIRERALGTSHPFTVMTREALSKARAGH